MHTLVTFVGAALVVAGCGSAAAQIPALGTAPQLPWYIGVGIGAGNLHRSGSDLTGIDNAQLDDSDRTYTVRAGWRFSPYFAVELGYYDLGRYDFHGAVDGTNVEFNGSARAQSVGLSLVGILPVDTLDFYGRIGYAHSKLKFSGNTERLNRNVNERQDEATYGLGVRWTFVPHWAVFAEWMKNDRIRVDSYLAGVDFRF
jgi:opacity protein-like surface antigen